LQGIDGVLGREVSVSVGVPAVLGVGLRRYYTVPPVYRRLRYWPDPLQ